MARVALRWPNRGPGVLLVHGFTDQPASVAQLGEALGQRGYNVYAPILAGHGGTAEELRASTAVDWRRSAELALLELVEGSAGNGVAVCGLSLGGMLAMDLAAHFPVRALVMLNPAAALYERKAPLARVLWPVLPYLRLREGANLDRLPLRSVAELLRYIREARTHASAVRAPSLMLQSEFDTTVRPAASKALFDLLGSRQKEFEILASHEHVPREQAALFAERAGRFLDGVFGGPS
ncbi:MAG: alpha/beta fold hydrolase [Thermaerobacter sp.]|nr:alpha/beta fold hydrolase [Thermaerobacter sp.]